MQQRDFLLREIEKFGAIISVIRQIFFDGKDDNPAIAIEKQIDDAKGMLLNEMNFDFDKFFSLNY